MGCQASRPQPEALLVNYHQNLLIQIEKRIYSADIQQIEDQQVVRRQRQHDLCINLQDAVAAQSDAAMCP